MTLEALLFDGGDDDVVLHFEDASFTRGDLVASAGQLRGLLSQQGAGPGEVVVSVLPSSPACVAALFGTWSAGAALAPVNPRLTSPELERIVGEVRPAVVLTTRALAGDVGSVAGGAATVTVEDLVWQPQRDATAEPRPVDPGVALVLYTSGTTGRPKPVMLRRDTVVSAMEAVLRNIRGGSPDRERRQQPAERRPPMPNLVPFPLYLWSGIYTICFALRSGSPLVAMATFEPHRFAQLVRRFGITSVVVAPAMIAALLESDVESLEPLKLIRNGTAALPVSLARRFRDRFGVVVLNGYGQTELGGEVVGWNARDARAHGDDKLGSVGRPHPGIDLRIVDADGNDVAPGDTGELWVKSPFAMAGYLAASDTDRVTAEGFVRTGDLGHADDDGFIWLDGRRSDVINRSGLKVFPDEVEEALRASPEVADVAVVGVVDDRVGEVPWAFVVAAGDGPAAGLRSHLDTTARQRLAPYKVPAGYTFVDQLPRNDVGKVLRHQLRSRAPVQDSRQ